MFVQGTVLVEHNDGVVAVVSAPHRSVPFVMREEGAKVHMLATTSVNQLSRHQAIVEDLTNVLPLCLMTEAGNAWSKIGTDPRVRRSTDHLGHIPTMSAISADETERKDGTTLLQDSVTSGSCQ